MTLIEVVASLALLGSLLGGAVLAKKQMNEQWRAAERRRDAAAALDRQLTVWEQAEASRDETPAGDEGVAADVAWPRTGEGAMDAAQWWWRATRFGPEGTAEQPVEVIRYVAFDPERRDAEPAATIDVLALREPPLDETVDADRTPDRRREGPR